MRQCEGLGKKHGDNEKELRLEKMKYHALEKKNLGGKLFRVQGDGKNTVLFFGKKVYRGKVTRMLKHDEALTGHSR